MPRHPDFEKIYQSFLKDYGERGDEAYYRWLRKLGYDDTKPLEGQRGEEGFNWSGTVEAPRENLVKGEALHPVKTYHPEEWPEVRVYLEEELAKSAETLMGKPLLLDHYLVLPPPNRVVYTAYGDGALEYVAEVDDEVARMIRDGLIRHCSVEFDWERLERMDGVAPRGIEFTGLSLLKDVEPGDPRTTVELWEGILRHLKGEEMPEQAEKHPAEDGVERRVLGEGVIEKNPVAEIPTRECELIDEILEMLPESVPPRVGYFSTELVRRLRRNLLEKKRSSAEQR